MFCPQCKAEYRGGFSRCADCDVPLVASLSTVDSQSEGNLVLLWSGDDLALHASLLEELRAAGIPYFDRPIGNYSLRAFPNRFPASGQSPFGYEVGVLSSHSQTAKAIQEKVERLFETAKEDQTKD
jgi:hypothetical protein